AGRRAAGWSARSPRDPHAQRPARRARSTAPRDGPRRAWLQAAGVALDISEAAEKVRAKQVSPVELTEACLERIERLNPTLNAFVTVTRTSALEEARAAEAEIAAGKWRGPLHGIPIAFKDLVDVKGVPTTAASRLFADRIAE